MSGRGGEPRESGRLVEEVFEAERAVRADNETSEDSFRDRAACEDKGRSLHERQTNLEPDCKDLSFREQDRARSKGLKGTALFIMTDSTWGQMFAIRAGDTFPMQT